MPSRNRQENPAIRHEPGEPGGHRAKWSKSDKEGRAPHDHTCMWNAQQPDYEGQTVEWRLPEAGGGENEGCGSKGPPFRPQGE